MNIHLRKAIGQRPLLKALKTNSKPNPTMA